MVKALVKTVFTSFLRPYDSESLTQRYTFEGTDISRNHTGRDGENPPVDCYSTSEP